MAPPRRLALLSPGPFAGLKAGPGRRCCCKLGLLGHGWCLTEGARIVRGAEGGAAWSSSKVGLGIPETLYNRPGLGAA